MLAGVDALAMMGVRSAAVAASRVRRRDMRGFRTVEREKKR
ncbi:hypothetical protein GCM10007870_09820 [Gluconobacter kondonii]|uniref:Uncharacterized protein n=1 Tax=Gluconobacter kondonii TaxID=941463 RepID=A0ABQ5WQL5_9PROT|nr:hypothetical protein GCM10007870_09820 [Gluconobacter kondonii]